MKDMLIPKKIVEELDKYIISQDDAKKSVAISLRNRFRRKSIEDEDLKKEITPKNVILIGATGVGKTEIARRLARITDSPFIKVEATKFTEVGYVGKDVESMIKDLLGLTIRNLKSKKIEELKEQFLPMVYTKVAGLIKPYSTINEDEKAEMIKKIENGEYDGHQIEVEKEAKVEGPVIEVFANAPGEEDGMSDLLESIMSTLPGGKKKKKKMAVEHAVDYILRSEVEKSIDLDELIPEAISKVEEDGIVFIDEIDKIAEREGNSRGEVSRQGVQRDILPLVEGTTVMTKYGPVKTDHILFIAAGAFTLSSPSDLMPELQGRFPVRVKLKSLEKEDFIKILTQVEYNLIEQYKNLLKVDNVELDFTKQAIEAIADVAIELNESIENIGARRLASVIETVLRELMYEAPYSELIKAKIGKKDVEKVFKIDAEEENLDKYIL